MRTPTVSICIPSYNHGRFIKECIESVLGQTYADFELIICDDYSSDNSVEVIKSFTDSRIRFYQNGKNIGVVGNINKTQSLCIGKYITSIGSDDAMMPDNLKRKVKFLDTHPNVGFVHSEIIKIDEYGNVIGGHWAKHPDRDVVADRGEYLNRFVLEQNIVCAPSVLVRQECYERLGLYDERLIQTQDYEMWIRMLYQYDIGYIAEPLLKYRWHQNNLSREPENEERKKYYREQGFLTFRIALQNYFQYDGKNKLPRKYIQDTFFQLGKNYFYWNNFEKSRIIYADLIKYKLINMRILVNYLSTFLPLPVIKFVRFIKASFRKIIKNIYYPELSKG